MVIAVVSFVQPYPVKGARMLGMGTSAAAVSDILGASSLVLASGAIGATAPGSQGWRYLIGASVCFIRLPNVS